MPIPIPLVITPNLLLLHPNPRHNTTPQRTRHRIRRKHRSRHPTRTQRLGKRHHARPTIAGLTHNPTFGRLLSHEFLNREHLHHPTPQVPTLRSIRRRQPRSQRPSPQPGKPPINLTNQNRPLPNPSRNPHLAHRTHRDTSTDTTSV